MSVESQATKDYSNYTYAKGVLKRVIDSWAKIEDAQERIRTLRYTRDMDSVTLRASGIIKPDECYSPVRVMDTNIRREQPQYINYLTQSPRSLVFVAPRETPPDLVANGESDFTKKARYLAWEKPFMRVVDGAQTFGWDAVEVLFDDELPGHFCVEHIGHGDLIFSLDCEDLQAQEVVIRRVRLTSWQLKQFVADFGWEESSVNELIKSNSKGEVQSEDAIHCAYKCFYRKDKAVFVGWFSDKASDWLKVPTGLFLGRRDISSGKVVVGQDEEGQEIVDYPAIPETNYPIHILPYVESEDGKITCLKGRGDMDESIQEAASALQTAIVNGTLRASNVYGAPAQSPINTAPNSAPRVTDVILVNGRMYDQPITFFRSPYPEPAAIQALQAVVSQNQQEQSQVNFTVLNRKDSNKTATEVNSAEQKASELSSIQIILLSTFIRSVYGLCWSIYQSRVLQQKIEVTQNLLPFFAEQDQTTGQLRPTEYILKSSGDVDVIEKKDKLNRMMQAWPVVGQTPIGMLFLKDILKLAFPDDAEKYITELDNQTVLRDKMLIKKLADTVQATVVDPNTGQLTPQAQPHAQQLMQLKQEVEQSLTPQNGEQQNGKQGNQNVGS
jgi:hypothetical protein